ncbi:MAG: GNAT family N-acetyltransferase [Pseudomonadota bacterium]
MYAGRALSLPSEKTLARRRDQLGAPTRPVRVSDIPRLHCGFHSPDALPGSIAAQWTVLADQASEPNCFAERWFLQPSLALLAKAGDVRIAAVTASDGMLVGLIPLTVKPDYGRIPLANVQNWKHHNSFLGAPLIRCGLEAQFWNAVLIALDSAPWARGLLHIRDLPADGSVLLGLKRAAGFLGRPCDIVHRTERALLASADTPEGYWDANVRKKKRKEINRLAKRLGECGTVRYSTLAPDEDVEPWIADFLALEKKGWKGAAGSAFACDPALTDFLQIIALGAHAAGKLDFHRLDLDGKPIAMLFNFLSAPGGFSYKIAFDEDYARYSPGVLIERYNLRILKRRDIDWIDSCAAENHSMINSLWTGRREIVRVSVPLGGARARWLFRSCRLAENSAAGLRKAQSTFKDRNHG